MNDSTLATLSASIPFARITCSRGRKWKGTGYVIGSYDSDYDYGWKHVPAADGFYYWERNCGVVTKLKVWEPETGKVNCINSDYCEDIETPAEQRLADLAKWAESAVNSTLAWCRSIKPGLDDTQVKSFARNVIRKQNPKLLPLAEELFGWKDNRDVVAEIQRTLQWALSLKSKPMMMYGRMCPGGKPYPKKKCIEIAKKALAKRGITNLDGYAEAWQLSLVIFGLDKFNDK